MENRSKITVNQQVLKVLNVRDIGLYKVQSAV